jgi:hypothetical protein
VIKPSRFSSFILIFAPLTLSWKLLPIGAGANELKDEMAGFLSRNGYKVSQETIIADMPVIHAVSGGCKIVLVQMSSQGWSGDFFAKTAESMDRKFVIIDGSVYPGMPDWLTVTSDRWSVYLRRIGILRPGRRAIAVAETSACQAETLPWKEFRS